jgi:hypothetical protein
MHKVVIRNTYLSSIIILLLPAGSTSCHENIEMFFSSKKNTVDYEDVVIFLGRGKRKVATN